MKALRRLAQNSFWALLIQFAPRFADVLLFVLIGRLYGPYVGGTFSLAGAYVAIAVAAMRGPDDFVTRHVLRAPEDAAAYFSAFFVLHLLIAVFTYGILVWIVSGVMNYAALTTQVTLLLLLGLIPENLIGIAQAVLFGQQRFHIPALVVLGVSVGKLGGGVVVLLLGGTLLPIAVIWIASSVIGMVVLTIVVWKGVGWAGPRYWGPIFRQGRTILAFLVITVLLALEGQADTIVLSTLHSELYVGWYRAAGTITFSLAIFAQAYQFAVYPLMTRYALAAPHKLAAVYFASLCLLGLAALVVIIGVWWGAPYLIPLIFSLDFQPAIPVLRVLIWALLFIFLNAPHARVMLACNQQGIIVYLVAISVTANILLNLLLAPTWGALGTAWARVCSSALFCVTSYVFIRRRVLAVSPGFGTALRELYRNGLEQRHSLNV